MMVAQWLDSVGTFNIYIYFLFSNMAGTRHSKGQASGDKGF